MPLTAPNAPVVLCAKSVATASGSAVSASLSAVSSSCSLPVRRESDAHLGQARVGSRAVRGGEGRSQVVAQRTHERVAPERARLPELAVGEGREVVVGRDKGLDAFDQIRVIALDVDHHGGVRIGLEEREGQALDSRVQRIGGGLDLDVIDEHGGILRLHVDVLGVVAGDAVVVLVLERHASSQRILDREGVGGAGLSEVRISRNLPGAV